MTEFELKPWGEKEKKKKKKKKREKKKRRYLGRTRVNSAYFTRCTAYAQRVPERHGAS